MNLENLDKLKKSEKLDKIEKLNLRKEKIAVIGLGYVGLPLALAFAQFFEVIGYDIDVAKIKLIKESIDPNDELSNEDFKDKSIFFTSKIEDISDAGVYIIAVPTPVDEHQTPDLRTLKLACEEVGKYLKTGDWVIFESTVYPGCTEEVCQPILERNAKLKCSDDFQIGYSPERINPGDVKNTFTKIVKVMAASNPNTCQKMSTLYSKIIKADIYQASSIKVAEASKIIENTQRDVNIALMNEFSLICKKMKLNTFEVLEAAKTKWNFINFYPGLVGGHCIGVDPYYLTYKAVELGYNPKVVLSGRNVNDKIPKEIAKEIVKTLIEKNKDLKTSKVLVMGITFKENVSDIRNSKIVKLIDEMKEYHLLVDVIDPKAKKDEVSSIYNLTLKNEITDTYDVIVLAVKHKEYLNKKEDYFLKISNPNAIFFDVQGVYREKIKKLEYLSL